MSDAAASRGEPAGHGEAESGEAESGQETDTANAGATHKPGTSTEATDSEQPDAAGGHTPPSSSGQRGVAAAVLGAAAVALIALSVVFGVQWWQERAQAERREAAVAAARQTVVNLTTINAKTAKSDVARLLEGTTGEFKQNFSSRRATFVKIVKQANVQTTGEVVAAGIAQADENSARVLVAARAQVQNSQTPKGQPRSYRLAIELQRKNGQWLASGVEFVP